MDPRPVFERATAQTARLVADIRPDQYGLPTPCSEFDVRRLVSHLVGAMRRVTVVGEGGDGMSVTPFADGVADEALAAAYEERRQAALKAWQDDARLDAEVVVPWGTVPGRAAVAAYVMETVTHAWDLWDALGRHGTLDPDLAEFALATAHRALPAEPRGGQVPFGEVRTAPAGSGPYEQLAAWLGREPVHGGNEG
ncbi:TIGR03086 family protein [Streptomyces sp. SID5785]|uniref:TIGR03086 family metal-binding protein n=1 Tax=Streptomyces sp. SID5785 TaxID=2690309 RepID=UPI001361B0EC|nr:TIGR03086 family metal-binding protein [Streptomyces sp. SID5785]MZD05439.1 TIGR03086 family protein [Streptomyces sp. SID5785]